MGSFYLDVIKDRQYTAAENSVARRSAQTALYHVSQALVRWIAPILSFTATEIWKEIPGENAGTVFAAEWYTGLSAMPADAKVSDADWHRIMLVRESIQKQLESLREQGQIGKSLEANIVVKASGETYQSLEKIEDELRFVVITSKADLSPLLESDVQFDTLSNEDRVAVSAQKSSGVKCVRCWHWRDDVGVHEEHAELCGRCVENVIGQGEARQYA